MTDPLKRYIGTDYLELSFEEVQQIHNDRVRLEREGRLPTCLRKWQSRDAFHKGGGTE